MRCPKCQNDNPETQRFCGECGTQLFPAEKASVPFTKTLEIPAEELISGALFAGRYQIIEELGKGGMGKVYRALDKTLNEEVALKLIKPEIGSDKKTLERFHNELKLARRISHRNVGRMYELLEEKGTHFITMEYVPGEDLKSLVKRVRQLAPGTALAIAKQMCEGLSEAHRLGIIHRDLKPSNIMIDKEGDAKIMDFGIARTLSGKGITGEAMIIGTPEYMSPEQVEGKEADQRSDIYSLGIILYEMLTGRSPFEGDTPFSVALKQKTEIPVDPKNLNPQIPPDLNELILKCLDKDRAKRFQTAGDLLADLSIIEQAIPTTQRVMALKKTAASKERTVQLGLKKAIIGASIVVALAVGALFLWRIFAGKGPRLIPSGSPSLAVMYFKNNTGDDRLDHWRTALADAFIADLSQSKYLEVLSGEKLFQILDDLHQSDAKSFSADVLKQVAAQGRVNHILVGDYAKAGEIIRIHIALQDARTEKILASESAEGRGEPSIFTMVDELTTKIKADLNLSAAQITRDIDKSVGEITTKSPEAYKYYVEGIRFHDKGEPQQAIPLLEKALSLDPEFAMAYRGVAICYQNLGLENQYKEYLRKALEFSKRLSERERYHIAGDFGYTSERTFHQAIENFTKLLELYPQSVSAAHNLGNVYFDIEDWDRAIEYYQACLKNKSPFIWSYEYLADAYRAKGLDDRAYDALQDYLRNIADDAFVHYFLAHHYICKRQVDLAERELNKALTLSPTHIYNSYLGGAKALYQEDWDKAEQEFGKLVQQELPESWYRGRYGMLALSLYQGKIGGAAEQLIRAIEQTKGLKIKWAESEYLSFLSRVYLISGKPEEALNEAEKAYRSGVEAERLALQRIALHHKGLAYAAQKSISSALKAADELKALIDSGLAKKEIRRYDHLLGLIELEQGGFRKAIEYLERAASALPLQNSLWVENGIIFNAFYLEPLAQAYFQSGNDEKAREVYEKIIGLTVGRFLFGDIYARSFYWLGKIAEKQEQKLRAAEYYKKFLDLWKDADSGLPEVEDAQKRLERLQNK